MSNVIQFAPRKKAYDLELNKHDLAFIAALLAGRMPSYFPGGKKAVEDTAIKEILRQKKERWQEKHGGES